MRRFLPVVALFLLSPLLAAQDKQPAPRNLKELVPHEFEVGQVGRFKTYDPARIEIFRIVGPKEMLVRVVAFNRANDPKTGSPTGPFIRSEGRPFSVKGISTSGLVDGKTVTLEPVFMVRGTETYKTADSSNTVFVVSPETNEEKQDREKRDAERAKRDTTLREAKEAADKVVQEAKDKADRAAATKAAELKEQKKAEAARLAVEPTAALRLKTAKALLDDGQRIKAIQRLEQLITEYPQTKAADEARRILKQLGAG